MNVEHHAQIFDTLSRRFCFFGFKISQDVLGGAGFDLMNAAVQLHVQVEHTHVQVEHTHV
jgi:hypothetical protein